MVRERRTSMGCRDCGDAEHLELAVREMGGEIPTVEAALHDQICQKPSVA